MQNQPINSYFSQQALSQTGAVLFVSLIMLVVVTLMGVIAMKSSTLQEKLAAAAMDQNVAFQAAESALRDAEMYINNNLSSASGFSSTCIDGLCLPSTTSVSAWDSITDWSTSALPIVFGSQTAAPPIASVARQPKYIIELMGDIPCAPGCSARIPLMGSDGTAFRITAMGWGRRTSTPVMLQSIYVKI
jgi:type IV pilus assembly protein PilX